MKEAKAKQELIIQMLGTALEKAIASLSIYNQIAYNFEAGVRIPGLLNSKQEVDCAQNVPKIPQNTL